RGEGITLDIEPEIFALKKQRSVCCRCFRAVNLRAGDARERAGRDQRGRVDAQFRTVAQGERLRPGDQIVRWLDQPLGIAADVQRVILAADDLTRRARDDAKLFCGARWVYA